MTGKERLERIIQMQYDGYTIWDMGENDLVWLIEQAGRVQELENRIADDEHFVAEILEQNKRYRGALKFYAEESNYDYDVKVDVKVDAIGDDWTYKRIYTVGSKILDDGGEKARKALGRED